MVLRRVTARAALGLVPAALVLTACSSHAAASSPTAPSASAGTTGATPGRCTTDVLSGQLVPGSPGAGQRYATLVLTNTGGQTCTVSGYGGLGLVASDGRRCPPTRSG